MSKNEQIVPPTKKCAHVISGLKQLLAKVTYDEPPLLCSHKIPHKSRYFERMFHPHTNSFSAYFQLSVMHGYIPFFQESY